MAQSRPFVLFAAVSLILTFTAGSKVGTLCSPAHSAVKAAVRTLKADSFVYALGFSPDGKILASGDAENNLLLWDVKSGKMLNRLLGHKGAISSLAFSSDGHLLSASWDNTIKLWDTQSGKELKTFTGHRDRVSKAIFSADGKKIASVADDKTAALWDLETGKKLLELELPDTTGISLALSKDSKSLFIGSETGKITEWDLPTLKAKRTIRLREGDIVGSLVLSPDGSTLIAGCNWDLVFIDTPTGRITRAPTADNRPWGLTRALDLSPDGKTVAIGGADKAVTLFDEATGGELKSLWEHTEEIDAVAFSRDGNTIASGGQDHLIKLWDVAWTKGPHHPIDIHPKTAPVPKGLEALMERDGVSIANMKYVAAESKRDPSLEKALRLNGWCSGEDEETTVKYAYNKVDLNGDGKPELVVFVYGPAACGSGGCHAKIAKLEGNRYKIIGSQTLVQNPIVVTNKTTRGWKDIVFSSRYGYFLCRWNGTNYPNGENKVPPYTSISGTAFIADKEIYKKGFRLEAP